MTDAAPPPDDPAISRTSTDGTAGPLPLEIQEFLGQPPVDSSAVASSSPPSLARDGPSCWYLGVGEALAWFMGTLIAHIVGAISVLVIIIIWITIKTGTPPAATTDSATMVIVTCSEMLFFVLASMLAISLRYWGRTFNELNLSCPDPRHVAIVVAATLPLSFCVSALSIPAQLGWRYISQQNPWLEIFDNMNVMEMVKEMARSMSLPFMILIVAVLPAIGEELVFRGAIGRVLIAHLGIWGGVLLTSFLFGCVHIHPVHALAVMPLGLAMHLIYLWTRSFWMPMLLHFLNNSWATLTAHLESGDAHHDLVQPSFLECVEMVTAVFAVVFLAVALWQSRIRYFEANGSEWSSPRFPIRIPGSTMIHRKSSPMNSICFYAAVICVIACHSTVAFDLFSSHLQAN